MTTIPLSTPEPLLEHLVSIDTQNPPGSEVEAAQVLRTVLAEIGFEAADDEYAPGRANVIGKIDNGPGPVFAFNTHIDVVPAGEGWTYPPLQLTQERDRLYGRGSNDAKGPLAAMVCACQRLAADRSDWSGTLLAVFVGDEEAASSGAKHYAAGRPKVDFAIIGEPTSNNVVSAHKGSLRPLVRVRGLTAHSGTPDLGINAIFKAARLLGLLEDHAKGLSTQSHPLCGSSSLTVTRATGGHADNVVPEVFDFLIDRRMVPGESETAARAEIEGILAEAQKTYGIDAEILEWRPTTGGPTETPADHPIVRTALAAAAAQGADGTRSYGFQGGCDLVHFRSIGASGAVLGPGDLAVAHKPDEFVPISELHAAVSIYETIARQMLRS
jgi:acetylornithine deacetylase/succinyl-diaminopimelate desuccinylase